MLRQQGGVVSRFVELHNDDLDNLSLADRATIANMAPKYWVCDRHAGLLYYVARELAKSGRTTYHLVALAARPRST